MTVSPNIPKYLAIQLLDAEVSLPSFPETHGETINEYKARLGDQLPDDIVGFLSASFEGIGFDEEKAKVLDALGRSVHLLSRTGRTDRELLSRGEAMLEDLVTLVNTQAEEVRARLSPSHPMLQSVRDRSGEKAVEGITEDFYFHYLGLRCAAETLEILKNGIRQINIALRKVPNLPSRQ